MAVRSSRARHHTHAHFELFFLEGKGVHANDFRHFQLHGPTVVVATPGQVHGWPDAKELKGTMFAFTHAFICAGGAARPLLDYPFVADPDTPPVARVSPAYAETFRRILLQAQSEFEAREVEWIEIMRSCLRILLSLTARIYATDSVSETKTTQSTADLARRFRVMVDKDFASRLPVSAYARQLGVTPGHLNAILREHSGQSAGAYIRGRILLEARRWLLHSELGISEIAYRLGFEDPSYFARFFRRQVGESPGSFRRQTREKHPTIG